MPCSPLFNHWIFGSSMKSDLGVLFSPRGAGGTGAVGRAALGAGPEAIGLRERSTIPPPPRTTAVPTMIAARARQAGAGFVVAGRILGVAIGLACAGGGD